MTAESIIKNKYKNSVSEKIAFPNIANGKLRIFTIIFISRLISWANRKTRPKLP